MWGVEIWGVGVWVYREVVCRPESDKLGREAHVRVHYGPMKLDYSLIWQFSCCSAQD